MDLVRSILFDIEEMPYDGLPHEIAVRLLAIKS